MMMMIAATLLYGHAMPVCLYVYLRTGWMEFNGVFDKMTLRSYIVENLSKSYDHTHLSRGKMRF